MISAAIMAHPKREAWIPQLVAAVDADVQVVWDERNDRWHTGRRALLSYDPDATHHLVIQDDALVCRDLVEGLTEAVKVSRDHPVGLYTGRVRPSKELVAREVGRATMARSPWVVMGGPWWGVGIVIPTHHIPGIVEYGDRRTDVANYDRKISRWYGMHHTKCWYTRPSLVEHRHGGENPSLIPGRTATNRRAFQFVGEQASALDVDWSMDGALVG